MACWRNRVTTSRTGPGMLPNQPEFIGSPVGVWLQIWLLSWAAVGAWIVTTHSFVRAGRTAATSR